MAESEKIRQEIQLIRCDKLFCRKCACYFPTKSAFNLHIQEHLEESNCCESSYMSYIEKYVCSNCGQSFEIKSDMIIHQNTVCLDSPFTCKHCRENCENASFLRMHLLIHHNYSEEMLRVEGFLTDVDDNPFRSNGSLMNNIESFSNISCENSDFEKIVNTYGEGSSALSKTTGKFRRSECKRRDLAFNLLVKMHTCVICNESFSRKCVLDRHVRKHSLKRVGWKRFCENNYNPVANTWPKITNTDFSEVTAKQSDIPRAVLQPSNVVLGSSIWKRISPKSRPQYAKASVSSINTMQKSKSTDISEVGNQNSNNPSDLQLSNGVVSCPVWKNIKLKTKLRDIKTLDLHVKEKSDKIKEHTKSKARQIKQYKKKPRYESKPIICELCNRIFKDSYKLKRHNFTHTGERPYSCIKCNKTFSRDDHLKRHLKKVCYKTEIAK